MLIAFVAGLLVWAADRSAQAKTDPTKKLFTFPNPVKQKLAKQEVSPVKGKIELAVDLALPKGWKWNAESPTVYYVDVKGAEGPVDRTGIRRQQKVPAGKGTFIIPISVGKPGNQAGKTDAVEVTLNYFICQEDGEGKEGICRAGSVIWTFPLHLKDGAKGHKVSLTAKIPAS